MNYILGLTLIGIITGLFGGLVVGVAEILIVPLLTFFGLLNNLKNKIGTSLFMLLPPIGIFAALNFYNKGHVDLFAALYMGLIFTIFSLFSSKFTLNINITLLRQIFGLFTIFAGFYIFFNNEK